MGRKRAGQPRRVRHTVAGQFGRRLEQLATAAGLTTAEFAKKAGVTEDAVRKYFRGTDVPRLDRWPRIARALGVEMTPEIVLIM
jgi:transcriptional regulator with XRE-family HTH domain